MRVLFLSLTLLAIGVLLGCNTAEVPEPAEPQPAVTPDDKQAILGHWRVVRAVVEGEPYEGAVGTIHTYTSDGMVQTVGHDYESNFYYLIEPESNPPRLLSYISDDPSGVGIYELQGDRLHTLEALDEQPLSFNRTEEIKGLWSEEWLERISAEEAAREKAILEDERLGIKASGNG